MHVFAAHAPCEACSRRSQVSFIRSRELTASTLWVGDGKEIECLRIEASRISEYAVRVLQISCSTVEDSEKKGFEVSCKGTRRTNLFSI